jgi:hypothetical protein
VIFVVFWLSALGLRFRARMSTSCGDDELEDIEDLVQVNNPKAQARRNGNQAGNEFKQVN